MAIRGCAPSTRWITNDKTQKSKNEYATAFSVQRRGGRDPGIVVTHHYIPCALVERTLLLVLVGRTRVHACMWVTSLERSWVIFHPS
jgi:hypothetical protein